MKKIFNKRLIINILIPVILGAIAGLLSNTGVYTSLNQPPFSPPAILFPIVWTVLYILMGIGNYLTDSMSKYYKIQLIFNLIWPFIFFRFNWYFIAFVWLLALAYLVIQMLKDFKSLNSLAFKLNIPYLAWLLFAAYLNFGVFILN